MPRRLELNGYMPLFGGPGLGTFGGLFPYLPNTSCFADCGDWLGWNTGAFLVPDIIGRDFYELAPSPRHLTWIASVGASAPILQEDQIGYRAPYMSELVPDTETEADSTTGMGVELTSVAAPTSRMETVLISRTRTSLNTDEHSTISMKMLFESGYTLELVRQRDPDPGDAFANIVSNSLVLAQNGTPIQSVTPDSLPGDYLGFVETSMRVVRLGTSWHIEIVDGLNTGDYASNTYDFTTAAPTDCMAWGCDMRVRVYGTSDGQPPDFSGMTVFELASMTTCEGGS